MGTMLFWIIIIRLVIFRYRFKLIRASEPLMRGGRPKDFSVSAVTWEQAPHPGQTKRMVGWGIIAKIVLAELSIGSASHDS